MMRSMERWAPDGGAGWAEYGSFLKQFYLFLWPCYAFIAARAFSSCSKWGPLFSCNTQASHCSGSYS